MFTKYFICTKSYEHTMHINILQKRCLFYIHISFKLLILRGTYMVGVMIWNKNA